LFDFGWETFQVGEGNRRLRLGRESGVDFYFIFLHAEFVRESKHSRVFFIALSRSISLRLVLLQAIDGLKIDLILASMARLVSRR